MKKLIGFVAAVSVFVCLLCQLVLADTVVYSQPYNSSTAYYSDVNFPQLIADDFVLDQAYDITDVHWWGPYAGAPPTSDNFTIAFYADIGGPSKDPFASYVAGDIGRSGTGIYAYSYDLSAPLSLAGGTTYYISIYNNTPEGNWAWQIGDNGNTFAWYRYLLTNDWIGTSGLDFAFELTTDGGTVIPEPITSTLFVGSVLLGLGRLRRRRA